ncbi:hypothetical protein Tfer_1257 [Thermincola ferriacetica]|uniref:FlgN family protein n=1 Tax=Thermincola ferriacetica TaxID=281456 RepID=A0A0L6W3S3_9FIRM|nr:flagellar protein FliT [Thermincola ferriacetica]KNZ70116.1 hypothetical protein Tfer_1257 [Thermincola ferriacetica]
MKVKNLNSHIEHIINGYQQQSVFYEQLRNLSRQLRELIETDNWQEIDKALDARADIIKNINEINSDMEPHKKEVVELLHLKEFNLAKVQDLIYPQLRRKLEEETQKIKDLLKEIVTWDRQNMKIMEEHKISISQELKQIKQYREFQQAYLDRPEMFPEPVFFDKKK